MRWISLGVLAAASLLLAAFWGDVPARWVIHWDLHGQPDGWATKGVVAAALPLALGLVSWLVLEAIARWITRTGAARTGYPRELMLVHATVTRAVAFAIVLLCAGLAVGLPLLRPRSSTSIIVALCVDIVLVVGVAIAWATRQTRRLRESGIAIPDGYHGVFYKNPRDARLWVPKLAGIGWTINFAHRFAWPVMIALVGVPVALILLLSFAGR